MDKIDKYLTTEELSELIKMSPGTIRNLVWKNVLQEGRHYVKPTPRKLLFKRRAVEAWLYRNAKRKARRKQKSNINA